MTPDQLAALKQLCREGESPEQHEEHRVQLEDAYRAFSADSHGGVLLSRPAVPGTTQIAADITVATEVN